MRHKSFSQILILVCCALAISVCGQTKQQTGTKKSGTTKSAPAQNLPPALEPKAIELLKATSEKISSARVVSFTAVELIESLSRQAVPLGYTTKYEVSLQRPNKLRVTIPADGPASDFYYDGKTMTAVEPHANLIAVADAPSTIDATLEKAYKQASIYFPFTDLIVANPYGDLAPSLRHAYYIGQSNVVGGTATDMVAYEGDDVFVQMWIGVDDKLPRMVRAVYVNDPDMLRHEMTFSDWKLDESVPADAFRPNVANARTIPFANPNPEQAAKAKVAKPATKTQ
ncbi:MAG TPA: DUF2092 domain-containing protein [Terriglobales bacterium]|nr:DUF2092 domain-containing protein [Terriglobales bacterium]